LKNIDITLRRQDIVREYSFSLPPDIKILDFRLNAQTLVGFDDEDCRLVLERTGQELSDSSLVQDTVIQPGDVLIVLPPVRCRIPTTSINSGNSHLSQSSYRKVDGYIKKAVLNTVSYRLILTINGVEKSVWEHSIELLSHHENTPIEFFEEFNSREHQKLEEFLAAALERSPTVFELNKITKIWCEDIKLGYRETFAELQR
jgi:hypothetical protein